VEQTNSSNINVILRQFKVSTVTRLPMQPPACAADARASLQQSLLRNCKTAGEEEAAVICAALAAVKGAQVLGDFEMRELINCVFYRHNSSRIRDASRDLCGTHPRCCIVSTPPSYHCLFIATFTPHTM
jgi:hypothetical protein